MTDYFRHLLGKLNMSITIIIIKQITRKDIIIGRKTKSINPFFVIIKTFHTAKIRLLLLILFLKYCTNVMTRIINRKRSYPHQIL